MRPSPFGSLRLRQYCYEQMSSLRRGPLSDSRSSTCFVSLALSLLGHSPDLGKKYKPWLFHYWEILCVCVLVTQSSPLSVTPWAVARQAPLSMGSSGKNTGGLPFASPGDLSDPGIELRSPALLADSLPSEPPGSPLRDPRTSFLRAS